MLRRGRPRKAPAGLTEVVSCRLTDDEYRQLVNHAFRAGESLADYTHRALLDAIRCDTEALDLDRNGGNRQLAELDTTPQAPTPSIRGASPLLEAEPLRPPPPAARVPEG